MDSTTFSLLFNHALGDDSARSFRYATFCIMMLKMLVNVMNKGLPLFQSDFFYGEEESNF